MNFFAYRTAAERYSKYRPYFHPLVIEKINAYLHIQRPLDIAVDVGCGSGQSTMAMKEIADFVVGADISAEMLHFAEKKPGIRYVQASAEELAIEGNSCDLLTTSLAYHWFNQEWFLSEAHRILKDEAWLVIHNNGFSGQMKENSEFQPWVIEVYVNLYPTPPRNSVPLTPELAHMYGFNFAHQEEYQNEVRFSVEELSAYLTTQSNVISATEQGNEKVEDVYHWLVSQIEPFFHADQATFVFEGYIWYLKKACDNFALQQ